MAKAAGVHVDFTGDAAKLLTELERVRKETQLMRKTVDRSANRVKYAFNKIRRAAQVVASAFIFTAGVRQLGNLVAGVERAADSVLLMQARFEQFGRSASSFQDIYRLSQRLGVSMNETAQTFTRLLVATKNLNTSQDDLLKIQENIVVLARAGGTSLEEMTGGLRQLSQGLASGRLAGEELRSVLENLPLVAMEIAKEMGITIGEIRKFAAEGKITGKIVTAALENVEIKLEDLPKTFEQQTERMRTEWTLLLAAMGNALETSGILESIEKFFKGIRERFFLDFSTYTQGELSELIGLKEDEIANILKERAQVVAEGGSEFFREGDLTRARQELQAMYLALERTIAALDRFHDAERARGVAEDEIFGGKDPEDYYLWGRLDQITGVGSEIERQTQQWEKWKEEAVEAFQLTLTPAQQLEEQIFQMRQRLEANPMVPPEQIDDIIDGFRRMKEGADENEKAWKQLGMTFRSAFEDAIVEGEKLSDVLKSLYKDILRIWVRTAITEPFTEWMRGVFGRASGGPVSAGTGYIVGEEGPEYFTPNRSGFIVPNHKLGMAGGAVVTYNIDARGADDSIFARLIPLLESTKEATENSIRHQIREGRFT